jgi:hypothetical protein
MGHARYVLLKKFEQLTGYTPKAVERKIASGVWREGKEYRKAPDGHIAIDMEAYVRWVEQTKVAA